MTAGRLTTALAAVGSTALMTVPQLAVLPLKLVYNASASAPIGWYAVSPDVQPAVGDLVVVRPTAAAERLLVSRRYLGAGVPLVKHIAARAGSSVCRAGDQVSIDAAPVGHALDRDGLGRPLPRWSGCRVLGAGEVFLFNGDVRASFDGRYFGPTPTTDILGEAHPLWTR